MVELADTQRSERCVRKDVRVRVSPAPPKGIVIMVKFVERLELLIARARIERPSLLVAPQFRATLFVLWLISVASIIYPHVIHPNDGLRTLSIALSGGAWIGSVIILLLANPKSRIKRLMAQMLATIVTLLTVFVLSVGIVAIFENPFASLSLRVIWIIMTGFLGFVALLAIIRGFLRHPVGEDGPYPAMHSAPGLFIMWAMNVSWWFWSQLLSYWR